MKRWNINMRVLMVAVVPSLSIALLLSIYFARSRFADLEGALADRSLAIARQLAPAAEFGVFTGNREVLDRLVAAVAKEPDVTAVTIRDADDKVLASSSDSVIPPMHHDATVPMQSDADDGNRFVSSAPIQQSRIELEDFFSEAASAPSATEPKVIGRVYVAMSRSVLAAQRAQVVFDTLVITFLILVANVLLAVRMGRNVSRPMDKLTRAVQKIADGDLDARVTPDSGGVVRGLEDGVNAMAAALKSAHADLERRIADATAQLEQKKEEAERANRAKSRFLAAASHDLRQPLHALGLFVASLSEKPLAESTRRTVQQIERSVVAMQDLLDALLNISKLDAGAITPNVTDVPVYKLIAAMEMHYAAAADNKGIDFRTVPCSAVVRSDSVLLERILLNLVANAVRYTVQGKILLGCRRRGDKLRIEVWDTGIGIPENQQQHIFDEFYQVAGSQLSAERGLGLGLAIVDRLARLLGHSISLHSAPGQGSVFVVEVPLTLGKADDRTTPVAATAVGRELEGLLVLVVDDDASALLATKALLESWGCSVFAARSGAEAKWYLSAARERLPQLVICDYRLSSAETGIHVLDHIRQSVSADICTILVSADTSAEVLRAAQESGYPLLYKPLRPAKLRALTLHLLARAPA
ncbi:MAG: response regulator [Gammaproteobacteria bacterium]|nr:response regulator [Gammaproteobacteria bacterium]